MDMVSIKKYLRPGKPGSDDYIRFLQALLTGISLHAVEANETDLTRFRLEVSAISAKLDEHSTSEEIDAAIDFVIRAVDGYNQIASRMSQAHLAELQAMLAMTTETICYLSDSSKTGIEQLQLVERNLQQASSIRDVRLLRGKLDDCLTLVRSESNRLRDQSRTRIRALQEAVERTSNHVRSVGAVVPDLSPVRRDEVEQLIAAKIAQGKEFVVAIFAIDGLSQIASRYGPEIADDIQLAVVAHLKQALDPGTVHRWSGPALAAILELRTTFQAMERQMHELAAVRLEKTIEKDERFVLLPITCSLIVQKVSDADAVEDVIANLDDFVAAHAGARRH
jgi:GGDEF domain-containing protein